jgi:MoaA/NifB/PqqE/SkfB family radical SAM enzyme/SAM-dependent methyltransferase
VLGGSPEQSCRYVTLAVALAGAFPYLEGALKALIKVGYACNDHCTFCHTLDVRHIDDTSENVFAKIARARQLGHSMVVFSGGEPTIRPEITAWATRVAELGLDLGFVTNGRMFAYEPFVASMLERRLKYVYLSLHGGTARMHNSLVRADAFTETLEGVKRLHGRIPVLSVNCVVTQTNVRKLRAVVDLLLPYDQLTIKFSMSAPKGGGDKLFEFVIPPVEQCAEAVADAIAYGEQKRGDAAGPRFAHDGIPLCLVPEHAHLYDDLRTNDFRTMTEVGEPDYFPVDDIIKVQPDAPCAGCSLRGPCPGLFRGYLERYPQAAGLLTASAEGARSNSYNFTPTRDIARPAGAPCPVKSDGTTSYDRARTVFLRLRDRMRLYESRTRDFADVELLATKEDLGQLYVDVSTKLAPDDFSRDLRKLRLLDECRACEERPRCTGCWAPVPHDLFTRDDARVHELLRGLEGSVLDVGAGEGSYLETLAGPAASGRLRYLALEPDGERAALLGSRYPWANFQVEPAERANLPEGGFDHALVLRSYNHLDDPAAVLAALARALRPGGTLTVVDNVAFGLLRGREHAAKAERGPGKLEHHRNDDAARAHAIAGGLPLRLIERCDVGPATSNQWLLRYERISGDTPS